MPIEETTEEVQTTKTKTTRRYICDVEGCDRHVENWDPKGDDTVRYGSSVEGESKINYVSLNPRATTRLVTMHGQGRHRPTLKDEEGVYVCDEHVPDAMRLIIERLSENEEWDDG